MGSTGAIARWVMAFSGDGVDARKLRTIIGSYPRRKTGGYVSKHAFAHRRGRGVMRSGAGNRRLRAAADDRSRGNSYANPKFGSRRSERFNQPPRADLTLGPRSRLATASLRINAGITLVVVSPRGGEPRPISIVRERPGNNRDPVVSPVGLKGQMDGGLAMGAIERQGDFSRRYGTPCRRSKQV